MFTKKRFRHLSIQYHVQLPIISNHGLQLVQHIAMNVKAFFGVLLDKVYAVQNVGSNVTRNVKTYLTLIVYKVSNTTSLFKRSA